MNTKGEMVSAAYSRGRISGLTSQPTPEENELGLRRLENMASEFMGRNIDVGYFFEDTPGSSALHNIPEKYWDAFETNLAVRLLGDFGKSPVPALAAFQSAGYSFLSADTAPVKQTPYPNRQPRGSGNRRYNRWQRYYRSVVAPPLDVEDTITMTIGDINEFIEHFDAYLRDGENIASYTIEATDGITIVSDSLSTPDITYRIQADGGSDPDNDSSSQVKVIATTDDSRVETRVIYFELISR